MMNCTEINNSIDDYLDDQLMQQDQLAFVQHIEHCTRCADRLKRCETLMEGLKDISIPEPSLSFEQRVLAEVHRQHKDSHRYRFATGFTSAVAASLAIWFTSTVFMSGTMTDQPQAIAVAMNEVQTVRLMFDSHEDIQQVRLSIVLPQNMQLEGYPGNRELSWQTSLRKGENILALPIMAVEYGQGEMVATLNYGDKVKVLRVALKSGADGVLYLQQDDVKSALI